MSKYADTRCENKKCEHWRPDTYPSGSCALRVGTKMPLGENGHCPYTTESIKKIKLEAFKEMAEELKEHISFRHATMGNFVNAEAIDDFIKTKQEELLNDREVE